MNNINQFEQPKYNLLDDAEEIRNLPDGKTIAKLGSCWYFVVDDIGFSSLLSEHLEKYGVKNEPPKRLVTMGW